MSQTNKLKHGLKSRHIQMIALGGAIGTGFFLGSSEAIELTGPSVTLAYLCGGLIIYAIMRALGEMTVDYPCPGSFMEYARQNIGNLAGFIVGWNTWLLFTVVCMLEVTAVASLLDYWIHIPHWLTALVLIAVFGMVNLIGIKYFGETEFWFAGIKVLAIIIMIGAGIFLIYNNDSIRTITFNNLQHYQHHGFFIHGFSGFLLSMAIVILAFGGSEFVSVAAGEAIDPQRSIPKAINSVIIRIILFYVLTMVIILLICPANGINEKISPFTYVFAKLGFTSAASIVNFIAITAALSSLNSCIYVASRFIYSLALDKMAPKKLIALSSAKIPRNAVIFTMLIAFLAVVANYFIPAHLLIYLFAFVSTGFIINWYFIIFSHIMFRKKNIYRHKNNYKMPMYPLPNILAIVILTIIIVRMLLEPSMAPSAIIAPIWIVALAILYKKLNYKE